MAEADVRAPTEDSSAMKLQLAPVSVAVLGALALITGSTALIWAD